MLPWLSRQTRASLTRAAEKASMESFCKNLRNMLMEKPLRGKVVMALDPGFKNGCKAAVISSTGEVLRTGIIYPRFNSAQPLSAKDRDFLVSAVLDLGVTHMAIGNGTACRETERMIGGMIKAGDFKPAKVVYTITDEQGASIYR